MLTTAQGNAPVKTRAQLRLSRLSISARWIIFLAILAGGAAIRFTGYNFQLPYVDARNFDEMHLFLDTMTHRGVRTEPLDFPGYPPGIIWVDTIAQIIVEQTTHDWILNNTGYAIAIVRFQA